MTYAAQIIQGGMGAGVSDWRLARAVSTLGCTGVVSGTAIDSIVARRLQLGDPDGAMRRALSHFPWPEMARRVLDRFYVPGGKAADSPFRLSPLPTLHLDPASLELLVTANFAEVFLAKEGHSGIVGINYLEKIQMPTLPSILGAMLAGVDLILMGGGIPLSIPGVLDGLARWEPVDLRIDVAGGEAGSDHRQRLDPAALAETYGGHCQSEISRPEFLGIVSSDVVAKALLRRSNGAVDGFVVENYTAGGHNAPPRRKGSDGKPGFGPRDVPDLEKIAAMGQPFWLAGGYSSPEKLREALDAGANGIQVGTPFGYCRESAIVPEIKRQVLREVLAGTLRVETDFRASPTGYPFKVVCLPGTIAAPGKGESRRRVCDLGYLRQPYQREGSSIGYLCAAGPEDVAPRESVGRRCLCNGLLATIGLAQVRDEGEELPIVTSGEDFSFVPRLVRDASTLEYSAQDVIEYLRG